MAGKVNLGDRNFNAIPKGKLSEATLAGEPLPRISTDRQAGIPLVALNATALATFTIPVVPAAQIIKVLNIWAWAEFVDAGVANYTVTNKLKVYILNPDIVSIDSPNFSPFFPAINPNKYDIIMNVNAGAVQIQASLYGGDVLAETGISPGALDTIQLTCTIKYLVL